MPNKEDKLRLLDAKHILLWCEICNKRVRKYYFVLHQNKSIMKMQTINELNQFCLDHNKHIIVSKGKLKGFAAENYNLLLEL